MPLPLPRPEEESRLHRVLRRAGPESCRVLGKMLTSSLLKTFFTGETAIFRNSPAPLYLVERKRLEEVYVETPDLYGQERAEYS